MEIPHTTDLDDILDAIQEQTEEIQKLKKENNNAKELYKMVEISFEETKKLHEKIQKLEAENGELKKVISDKYRSHSLQMTDEGFKKEYGFDKKIFGVEK